jgi:hypothetical protein
MTYNWPGRSLHLISRCLEPSSQQPVDNESIDILIPQAMTETMMTDDPTVTPFFPQSYNWGCDNKAVLF